MARRELVQLIDDLDGSAGDDVATIQFGLDGVTYEIDLNDTNANRLRGAVARYAGAARRKSGGRNLQRQHAAAEPVAPLRVKSQQANDAGMIREWATANGIELAARGRIPAHVVESYRAAQKDGKAKRSTVKTAAAAKPPPASFSANASAKSRPPRKRAPARK